MRLQVLTKVPGHRIGGAGVTGMQQGSAGLSSCHQGDAPVLAVGAYCVSVPAKGIYQHCA